MTFNKAKGRMFKSVGWTWNPVMGCSHDCLYCWARKLRERWGKDFEPTFRESFLQDAFPNDGTWIFVGSMGDLFCNRMSHKWINQILSKIADAKNNSFLLQTKNPSRLYDYLIFQQDNNPIIAGATIETNRETPWTKAPSTRDRGYWLQRIRNTLGFETFLSLEPLADFDVEILTQWIEMIKPVAIEIGLENYTNFLPKPPIEKINSLIENIENFGFKYILKDNLQSSVTNAKVSDD